MQVQARKALNPSAEYPFRNALPNGPGVQVLDLDIHGLQPLADNLQTCQYLGVMGI